MGGKGVMLVEVGEESEREETWMDGDSLVSTALSAGSLGCRLLTACLLASWLSTADSFFRGSQCHLARLVVGRRVDVDAISDTLHTRRRTKGRVLKIL
jgi:hypothetical protein